MKGDSRGRDRYEFHIVSAPGFIMQMKYRFPFFLFLIPLLPLGACVGSRDYAQSYVILMNGEEVGKESVTERTDRKGNRVCLSEQEMESPGSRDKKRIRIRTRMVLSDDVPVSYSYESSAGASYEVKVEDGQILRTSGGASPASRTPLAPDMRMLNPNVFHTIDYWIRQYDLKKGGQQNFRTYLLPSGSVERLSVFPLETGIVKSEGKDLELRNYRIGFEEGLVLYVWVDRERRLGRLAMEGATIDVVRSDLYKQYKAETAAKSGPKEP